MNTNYFVDKSTLDQGRDMLNSKHLIIGTIDLRPYISFINVSSNGHINEVDGYVHQIVLYLASKYHFTYEYIPSPGSVYGGFSNGSWVGLVGMLYRAEIDLIAASFTVDYERSQVIGFSVPFNNDDLSFIMPYPELDHIGTIDGIIRPFQYEVWILIVVSIAAVAIFLRKILPLESSLLKTKDHKKQLSLMDSFWSLFHLQNIANSRLPVRVLLYTWCLVTIVLVNAYSSILTSVLMTPRYHLMAESVEDIAKIQRPVFMASNYSANAKVALTAKSGTLLIIGNSMRKYPELNLNPATSHQIAPELVVKHRRTFATGKSVLLAMMEEDLKDTGQCRLYLAKKPWGTQRLAFGLPNFSPITPIFNREINWVRQVGLLDYWHRRNWPKPNRCTQPLTTKIQSEAKLSLNHVLSAFLFLGCGIAASLLIFLLELIVATACRHQ